MGGGYSSIGGVFFNSCNGIFYVLVVEEIFRGDKRPVFVDRWLVGFADNEAFFFCNGIF